MPEWVLALLCFVGYIATGTFIGVPSWAVVMALFNRPDTWRESIRSLTGDSTATAVTVMFWPPCVFVAALFAVAYVAVYVIWAAIWPIGAVCRRAWKRV